jgi:hypothetical protein
MKRLAFCLIIILGLAVQTGAQGGPEDPLVLGSMEGEGELLVPLRILEGPDGNIYALDRMDSFIKVYAPDGAYLRRLGGKGQGPGEIQRVEGVFFDFTPGGELYFTEFFQGHNWITLMKPDGNLIKVIKPDMTRYYGISRAACLPDGGFVVEMNFIAEPEKEKDYFLQRFPQELIVMDREGKISSTILKRDHITRISYADSGADSPIPFTPNFIWCLINGDRVLFSEGLGPLLDVYDLGGEKLETLETSLPPAKKVTQRALDEWRSRRKEAMESRDPGWYSRFGSVIEKYKKSIYKESPVFWRFEPTPEGNILVYGETGEEGDELETWLLSADGRLLGKLRSDIMGAVISRHFVFFARQDEDYIVTAYAMKRTGTEQEDFARLAGWGGN